MTQPSGSQASGTPRSAASSGDALGTSAGAGIDELRAALDALQTSLENLDVELFYGLAQWSREAKVARDAAVREWAETAQHMELIIRGLESRQALPANSPAE